MDFDIGGLSLGCAGSEPKMERRGPRWKSICPESAWIWARRRVHRPLASNGKDDHWYDVQTKFDLAKAYQEMGDKDGAREILKEVLQEGDAKQKTAAQSLLASLDS